MHYWATEWYLQGLDAPNGQSGRFVHYCQLCNMHINGEEDYKLHMKSLHSGTHFFEDIEDVESKARSVEAYLLYPQGIKAESWRYRCDCKLVREEKSELDNIVAHQLVAGHTPLEACGKCPVHLPPYLIAGHRQFGCDDKKASRMLRK